MEWDWIVWDRFQKNGAKVWKKIIGCHLLSKFVEENWAREHHFKEKSDWFVKWPQKSIETEGQ